MPAVKDPYPIYRAIGDTQPPVPIPDDAPVISTTFPLLSCLLLILLEVVVKNGRGGKGLLYSLVRCRAQ